jgi:uridylate kinase
MYKRVLIKISGEELAGGGAACYDGDVLGKIAGETRRLLDRGTAAAFVVGGGNLWRGGPGQIDEAKSHQIGMLATVMNGIYLSEAFRLEGVAATVMTPFEAGNFTARFSKEEALARMARGEALIFAGGTGLPFFSTDTIAAVRACELEVSALLLAKSVDGVYTADPKKDPGAKRYKTLPYATAMENWLRSGCKDTVADISALDLARRRKLPALVFGLAAPEALYAACGPDEALFAIGGTKITENAKEAFYVQQN